MKGFFSFCLFLFPFALFFLLSFNLLTDDLLPKAWSIIKRVCRCPYEAPAVSRSAGAVHTVLYTTYKKAEPTSFLGKEEGKRKARGKFPSYSCSRKIETYRRYLDAIFQRLPHEQRYPTSRNIARRTQSAQSGNPKKINCTLDPIRAGF